MPTKQKVAYLSYILFFELIMSKVTLFKINLFFKHIILYNLNFFNVIEDLSSNRSMGALGCKNTFDHQSLV